MSNDGVSISQFSVSDGIANSIYNIENTISEKYQYFKNNLKAKQSYYLNYFFYYLGQHYESIINNVNFFHYASEAILLENLKKYSYNNDQNIINEDELFNSNENMFEDICDLNFENYYFENIKLLTGSCYLYDNKTKISEMNLAHTFLKNFIEYSKNNKSNDSTNHSLQSEKIISFTEISKKAASATIAYFTYLPLKNSKQDENLFLYNSFNSLSADKNDVTLISFIKILEKEFDNFNIVKDKKLLQIVKNYYFFAKTKFEDYIKDLELYSDHSLSIFELIKKTSLNSIENYKKSFECSPSYSKLKTFYNMISEEFNQTSQIVKTRLFSFKLWINESIKNNPSFFREQLNFSKIFIYDKIHAYKNLLVLYTDHYVTFLMTNINNMKNSMQNISNIVKEKKDHLFENLLEANDFIKLSSDEKIKFIKIHIDNTMNNVSPTKFKEYVESLYSHMMVSSNDVLEKSKNYVIGKYQLFLQEKEN